MMKKCERGEAAVFSGMIFQCNRSQESTDLYSRSDLYKLVDEEMKAWVWNRHTRFTKFAVPFFEQSPFEWFWGYARFQDFLSSSEVSSTYPYTDIFCFGPRVAKMEPAKLTKLIVDHNLV